MDGKEQVVAAVSNITGDIRQDATIIKDGVVSLNPLYLGKVAELIGQEFGKNSRLQSARINEWRPDKKPEDCRLTKEDVAPKAWV